MVDEFVAKYLVNFPMFTREDVEININDQKEIVLEYDNLNSEDKSRYYNTVVGLVSGYYNGTIKNCCYYPEYHKKWHDKLEEIYKKNIFDDASLAKISEEYQHTLKRWRDYTLFRTYLAKYVIQRFCGTPWWNDGYVTPTSNDFYGDKYISTLEAPYMRNRGIHIKSLEKKKKEYEIKKKKENEEIKKKLEDDIKFAETKYRRHLLFEKMKNKDLDTLENLQEKNNSIEKEIESLKKRNKILEEIIGNKIKEIEKEIIILKEKV